MPYWPFTRPMLCNRQKDIESAMNGATEPRGTTRQELLVALLRRKRGLSVEAIAGELAISRNGVRQHLTTLERDGFVARGEAVASGGRPEQLYVLTPKGAESFPRQYSWFAELLLQEIAAQAGKKGLKNKLASLGQRIGATLQKKLSGPAASAERIASLAVAMNELGYDAAPVRQGDTLQIEAHNCVYHNLAAANQDVCTFDLALLASCSGAAVEHKACMVRGGESCRFQFTPPKDKARG